MERSQSEVIKNQDQLIEIMVTKKTLGGGIEKCMKEGGLPYGVRSSISQPRRRVFETVSQTSRMQGRNIKNLKAEPFPKKTTFQWFFIFDEVPWIGIAVFKSQCDKI